MSLARSGPSAVPTAETVAGLVLGKAAVRKPPVHWGPTGAQGDLRTLAPGITVSIQLQEDPSQELPGETLVVLAVVDHPDQCCALSIENAQLVSRMLTGEIPPEVLRWENEEGEVEYLELQLALAGVRLLQGIVQPVGALQGLQMSVDLSPICATALARELSMSAVLATETDRSLMAQYYRSHGLESLARYVDASRGYPASATLRAKR